MKETYLRVQIEALRADVAIWALLIIAFVLLDSEAVPRIVEVVLAGCLLVMTVLRVHQALKLKDLRDAEK